MNSILKSSILLLGTLILTFCFLSEEKSLVEIFSDQYQQNFNQFKNQLITFEKATESKEDQGIKDAYFELRKAYKAVEPVFLYFDPAAVNKKLNGAPLLKLEENSPGINILNPKGLQVIDEIMGEEKLDYLDLKENIINLKHHLQHLEKTIDTKVITHRMVIEMYQLNLIKLLVLEQSGFDTPGTLNGLEDSKTTFNTINQYLFPYLQQFPKLKKEVNDFEVLRAKGDKLLNEVNRFNDFDRAKFLSEVVEPLYQKTKQFHKKSGIEFYSEVSKIPQPYNEKAEHIFSTDFLNAGFYSGVDPTDENLIKLGKLLFFDPILSSNNKRACASCHSPQKGFTDQQKTSNAFDFNGSLDRNAQTLLNSIFASDYFWDLRAQEIRHQIEHVVFHPKEFATGFNTIENKLRKSQEYQDLFNKSFSKYNGEVINKNSIEVAITAYVQSLRGWNSEFDKFARGEVNNLSIEAQKGFNLFMGKAQCGICHFPPTFAGLVPPFFEDSESEVLGMLESFDTINPILDKDLGRLGSPKVKDGAYFFKNSIKTPTVRNTQITFPYMHNGAFETIEEVLHFYNHGGGSGLGLVVENQTLPSSKLNLTTNEMSQLKEFLHSLTDTLSIDLTIPNQLPQFGNELDQRMIGGEY